jgi:hypothetical protein
MPHRGVPFVLTDHQFTRLATKKKILSFLCFRVRSSVNNTERSVVSANRGKSTATRVTKA